MLYKDTFFMLASTFNDVLTGLQARDTAVEMHKLNRMITGPSALALHGIETGAKPDTLHLAVYEPNEKQIKYVAQEVPGVVCGTTGKMLPIPEMTQLNLFSLTVRDLTLLITFERNKQVPPNALLFRYGSSFYRVIGINDVESPIEASIRDFSVVNNSSFDKAITEYCEKILSQKIGQEFLDEPLPLNYVDPFKEKLSEANGYSVETDLIKIRNKVPTIDDATSLKRLFETYVTLRSCNKIDTGTDSEMILIFTQREQYIADNDPEG